jgi:predicted proteasome-type protease
VSITEKNPYFDLIHQAWGRLIREAFADLPSPNWDAMGTEDSRPVFERMIRSVDQ